MGPMLGGSNKQPMYDRFEGLPFHSAFLGLVSYNDSYKSMWVKKILGPIFLVQISEDHPAP